MNRRLFISILAAINLFCACTQSSRRYSGEYQESTPPATVQHTTTNITNVTNNRSYDQRVIFNTRVTNVDNSATCVSNYTEINSQNNSNSYTENNTNVDVRQDNSVNTNVIQQQAIQQIQTIDY